MTCAKNCKKNWWVYIKVIASQTLDIVLRNSVVESVSDENYFWFHILHCRVRFGRLLFFVNLFTYVGYLACLTSYVYVDYPDVLDRNGCSIYLNETLKDNDTAKRLIREVSRFIPQYLPYRCLVCRVFVSFSSGDRHFALWYSYIPDVSSPFWWRYLQGPPNAGLRKGLRHFWPLRTCFPHLTANILKTVSCSITPQSGLNISITGTY